jgi:MFS family permease
LSANVQGKRLALGVALTFMVIMAASYVVNAMDRQVFPAVVGAIQKSHGFSLTQSGLLSTIFTLGIGVAGIPTGFLLDRLSRKTVMLLGIAIYSLFTLLTALAVGFPDMMTYRAATGIGEAFQNAALFSAVGTYFSKHRTVAIGTLNFAYGLGGFFGPKIGGSMTANYGWTSPFYLYALLGFGFALLIWLVVSKQFTEVKEEVIESQPVDQSHIPKKLWNRNVILCALAATALGISIYGYVSLYTKFLTSELHFDPKTAASALSLFGLGALMGIPAGWIGDKLNQRFVIIVAFVGAMISGYCLFNVAVTPTAQHWLSFTQGMFGSGFLFVNVYSLIQRSVRSESVGRASGIFVSFMYLPSALSGYIFAWLVENFGWGAAGFWELSVFPVIGIIAVLFMKPAQMNTAHKTQTQRHSKAVDPVSRFKS